MPIKVLHLVMGLGPGGIEKWLMSMLRMASRTRIVMDFCCRGPIVGPDAGYCQSLGAEIFHCELKPTHIGFVRCLSKILQTNQYSLVHNHMQLYAGIGAWVAKKNNIPVITSFHNTSFPPILIPNILFLHKLRNYYGRISIKYALRNSDLVTGCSNTVLESIENSIKVVHFRKKVLYYGVEKTPVAESLQKQSFHDELGLEHDKILILNVGSMKPQKNHAGLVRVAEAVIARDNRAHFVLVGDGFLRPKIENMIEARQLTDNFTLLGVRNDVGHIMSCSDIFFFPSHWEGLGLVVLEAMAAGLPIVASDIPVFKETVTDGANGILWPVEDEMGMAGKLLELITQSDKRLLMGANGRQRAASKFSLEHAAEELWTVYESISNPRVKV